MCGAGGHYIILPVDLAAVRPALVFPFSPELPSTLCRLSCDSYPLPLDSYHVLSVWHASLPLLSHISGVACLTLLPCCLVCGGFLPSSPWHARLVRAFLLFGAAVVNSHLLPVLLLCP